MGRPGRHILSEKLQQFVTENEIDCVIANAENAAGGSGLTSQIYQKLGRYGVNLITMGDHIYRKKEIIELLHNARDIIRPANLSGSAAGREWAMITTAKGSQVAVVSLLGRIFMSLPGDNMFHAVNRVLAKIPDDIKIVVVDVHAEATSEKVALGRFLDGRVSVVFGTHTHIPTADEVVLPGGTAYVTDLGMTGAHESVLGRNIEPVIKSLITQMPYPYSVATKDVRVNGIVVCVDDHTGKAESIRRICIRENGDDSCEPYDSDDGRVNHNGNNGW